MNLRQLRIRLDVRRGAESFSDPWPRVPSFSRPEWRPPCDVYETSQEWVLEAEIAGVEEADLEVLLYEDGLVVQGTRSWRGPASGERDLRVHAAEIRYGSFRIALRLPPALDRTRARASYDRGLLVVRIPKRGAA